MIALISFLYQYMTILFNFYCIKVDERQLLLRIVGYCERNLNAATAGPANNSEQNQTPDCHLSPTFAIINFLGQSFKLLIHVQRASKLIYKIVTYAKFEQQHFPTSGLIHFGPQVHPIPCVDDTIVEHTLCSY